MPSGVYIRTERHSESLRKAHKGMLGRRHSEKTRNLMSIAAQGNKRGLGTKRSIESRVKMSKAQERINRTPSRHVLKLEKIAGRERPDNCEICGDFGRICFDHDHGNGKFRGWICHRCNTSLGLVKDNKEILNALIKYLENQK